MGILETNAKLDIQDSTVNERMHRLIFELRMNKKQFANSIGREPSVIGQIIQGRNNPSYDVLLAILKTYPQVSCTWLIMGEGNMFQRGEATSARKAPDTDNIEWAKKIIDVLEKQNEKLWAILEKLDWEALGSTVQKPIQRDLSK
jgi:transcriptional regulator with XRE-family HTH domain